MESLYLLVPLSAGLVLAIIGVFAWAMNAGQFDDLDHEATRILDPGEIVPSVDADQRDGVPVPTESMVNPNLESNR